MRPVLIGLNSRMHGGKDTAFGIMESWTQSSRLVVRRAFADPLKLSGMSSLGFNDLSKAEQIRLANVIKDTGVITIQWDEISPTSGQLIPRSHTITGREFWQYYGTEGHRRDDLGESFSKEFWVDNLLKRGWTTKYDGVDALVITDARFPNEAERIIREGGLVVEIDADKRLGPRGNHSSEKPLPRDLVSITLDNNGSIAAFEKQVIEFMGKVFG